MHACVHALDKKEGYQKDYRLDSNSVTLVLTMKRAMFKAIIEEKLPKYIKASLPEKSVIVVPPASLTHYKHLP